MEPLPRAAWHGMINLMHAARNKLSWKVWLNVFTVAALGVLVIIAWPDIISALQHSKGLNVWPLLAMLPLQILFYVALSEFFWHFFKVLGERVRRKVLAPAMAELNFVNHVFPSGGLSGFSYLTIRLKPHQVSTARSTLAQIGRFAFTFVVYIVLMFLSLFFLAIEDRASSLVVLLISIIVGTLIFCTVIVVYVIGSRDRIVSFTRALANLINKIIYVFHRARPELISLKKVETTFMEVHEDYLLLRSNLKEMRWAGLWMVAACLAEVALLYVVFVAHGVWINPGVVVVALVVASVAGLIAALPGGLGVYEPLMGAMFIAMGVSPGLALSATLVFRIISLFIILVLGFPLYQKVVNNAAPSLRRQRSN